jgi:hypothetical protein
MGVRACFKLYDNYLKTDWQSQISKNSARFIMATNMTNLEDQVKKTGNDEFEAIPVI